MQQKHLGLFIKKHLGTFGDAGVLSFNGNKPITCGVEEQLLQITNIFQKK